MLNTESVLSNISHKSFKTYNLLVQNCCCDHKNCGGVNQPSFIGVVEPVIDHIIGLI